MDSIISVFGSYVVWDVNSLLLFSVIFILTADYFKNRQPGSFPPGPRAFPIVGNIFTLDYSRNHEFMTELAGKYGDVYSLRMGQAWVVVLNSNGNSWKQQRRFALSTLRNFGFGKKSIEAVILDEFTYCAKVFKSYEGKPFNPHLFINNAVSNIICSLVFGHRFEYSNKKFMQLMELFGKSLQIQASIWAQLFNSFPRLMRRLPGPHQTVQHMLNDVKDFIRVEIKKHKQNWDPSDPRDYIDCFLNEIQMTTSTTLRWGFLYMAKYPEMQAKVQSEIDRVIGESRQPSMEDRPNMPYTDAVIHEIQRMGNLGGYTIQKGVTIIPNLTSALYDKNE
ncbi:Cytochrome P450 2J6 [Dissostichus eleginoides]|uniref:Cytochrome P450 2J6 n=1 Tax=Dissostichus eleginoides TaxID=100907 RepID=A0AAD9CA81_DISEL|nr:Cytochrome P450 2J6 [Dissostichus eleginoides]